MRPSPRVAFFGVATWFWPFVLVMALHLLSTAGRWWITDHGEILAVAERFLTTGRLDLEDLGPGWEAWTRTVTARGSAETRFLPLSIIPLVPLLILDHLFGWQDPNSLRFVHLEGHLFVGLGLGMVGGFLARQGAPAPVTALALLLLGLNWPVWMIARRIGPEPVLFALIACFATGGRRSRFVAQALLPWVHATGPLLGIGAWLALAAHRRTFKDRDVGVAALGLIVGVLSLAFFWNLPMHGGPVLGGYGRYLGDAFFVLRNPFIGAATVLAPMLVWLLPFCYLAVVGERAVRIETLGLFLPMVLLLSAFSNPEPERRLAPLVSAWAVIALPSMPSLSAGGRAALASLALISGVTGLSHDFVDTVQTPLGVFSGPMLLLLRLAFIDGKPLLSASIALTLLGVLVWAGSKTIRQLSAGSRPRLGT